MMFETDPPEATVTFDLKVISNDKHSGIFLGPGERINENEIFTLTQTSPKVKGLPDNYNNTPTGVYIHAVPTFDTSSNKSTISRQEQELLKSLGYVR